MKSFSKYVLTFNLMTLTLIITDTEIRWAHKASLAELKILVTVTCIRFLQLSSAIVSGTF